MPDDDEWVVVPSTSGLITRLATPHGTKQQQPVRSSSNRTRPAAPHTGPGLAGPLQPVLLLLLQRRKSYRRLLLEVLVGLLVGALVGARVGARVGVLVIWFSSC